MKSFHTDVFSAISFFYIFKSLKKRKTKNEKRNVLFKIMSEINTGLLLHEWPKNQLNNSSFFLVSIIVRFGRKQTTNLLKAERIESTCLIVWKQFALTVFGNILMLQLQFCYFSIKCLLCITFYPTFTVFMEVSKDLDKLFKLRACVQKSLDKFPTTTFMHFSSNKNVS